MWDVWADLVLGSRCAACGRAGRVLCRSCEHDLPRVGRSAWPSPAPPGLLLPMAAGDYDHALKALVNAHKERRSFSLARPLGDVLAGVVRDLARTAGVQGTRLALVPVPSRAAVVRGRGHDPMLRTARQAARRLRRAGTDAAVARLLAPTARVADQATLTAEQRAANLAGAFRARARRDLDAVPLVVVDDVITTGATAREAQRALAAAGLHVVGVAAVAATRRRSGARLPTGGPPSLPLSPAGD